VRRANQKRLLDNMVIADGEFTTEYFNRVDWRDMLGSELGQEIGRGRKGQISEDVAGTPASAPVPGPPADEGDLQKAFEAAEDEEDAAAAAAAQDELFLDNTDFAEAAVAPQLGEDGEPLPTPAGEGDERGEAGEEDDVAAAPASKAMAAAANGDEDAEDDLEGTIDGYMLNFAKSDWDDWFGDF
jgi:helicase SWR1